MDKYKTDVVFRVDNTKDFKGTVFALFPHECNNRFGDVTSYQHVGQHSSADYTHCIKRSKKATKEQYKDLKKEMKGLGYNLNVVSKQNYDKWKESYDSLESKL